MEVAQCGASYMNPTVVHIGRYAAALILILVAFLLRLSIESLVGPGLPVFITFYPSIMFIALVAGLGPGLLATAASVLLTDYYMITPNVFGNWTLQEATSLSLFTGMGIFMSLVAYRYRLMLRRFDVLVTDRTDELNRANSVLEKQTVEYQRLVGDTREVGRKSEGISAELETVFSAIQDAVLIYDIDMNVCKVNRAFTEKYGFNPVGLNVREIIERTRCRYLDGSPLVFEEQPTPRALQGEIVHNRQFRITRFNGEEAVLETTATPLQINGCIMGTVTVWHDVTEHKQAEELLRQTNEKLEAEVAERTRHLLEIIDTLQIEMIGHQRAEEELRRQGLLLIQQSRHAAMGEMIGNIAHQWRQPLNTLGLFTQRLGVFYGSPNFNKEFLETLLSIK